MPEKQFTVTGFIHINIKKNIYKKKKSRCEWSTKLNLLSLSLFITESLQAIFSL